MELQRTSTAIWATLIAAIVVGGLIALGIHLDSARTTFLPRTQEQVVGPNAPMDLRPGRLSGGPSEAPTAAGAGGSGAGGYEAGRVGPHPAHPITPPQPYGIASSRMSPVGSSGSGLGDRGDPIPPDRPLISPPASAPATPATPPGQISAYGSSVPL